MGNMHIVLSNQPIHTNKNPSPKEKWPLVVLCIVVVEVVLRERERDWCIGAVAAAATATAVVESHMPHTNTHAQHHHTQNTPKLNTPHLFHTPCHSLRLSVTESA